jgi:hypothetical protein
MEFRAYQYQSGCFAHQKDMPQFGQWVLQNKIDGQWRNWQWPFASKQEVENKIEEYHHN